MKNPGLHATLGGVHADLPVHVVEPDRGHLRRSVRHHGREIGEGLLLLQQVQERIGNLCHRVSAPYPAALIRSESWSWPDGVTTRAGRAISIKSAGRRRSL